MKKRLEDRLIELAFGDRAESGIAEFAATPEAAARLKEYREMRSALGQLRDLPDHQLSTERLRGALLHQGLKRRRSFPWQGLGYGFAACALFLCAFMVSRDLRRANAPATNVGELVFKPDPAEGALPAYMFGLSTPSVPVVTAKSTHDVERRSSTRHHDIQKGYLVLNSEKGPLIKLAGTSHPAGSPGTGPVGEVRISDFRTIVPSIRASGTPSSSRPSSMSNALVLIQSNTDADSGLDTAQEVTANGDVLVGG